MAMQIEATSNDNAALVYAFGGAHVVNSQGTLGWTYDGAVNPANLLQGWTASDANGNVAAVIQNQSFSVSAGIGQPTTVAQFEPGTGNPHVVPVASLFPSAGVASASNPLVTGSFALDAPLKLHFTCESPGIHATPTKAFAAAVARTSLLAARVVSSTPDAELDAGITSTAAALDGLYRDAPPVFLHGAMAWSVALVGWRSEYGATCWGWEQEVAAEGARRDFCDEIAIQVCTSSGDKRKTQA